MAKLNASAMAAKWQSKVAAAGPAYTAGVQAVSVNPAQQAAAAKDRWIAGVNAAAASGKFEKGLATVTLSSWKQACTDKGAAALAAGARLGAIKVQAHEQTFGPIRDQIVASLPARGTLDQNIERMVQMARGMATAAKNS